MIFLVDVGTFYRLHHCQKIGLPFMMLDIVLSTFLYCLFYCAHFLLLRNNYSYVHFR